MYPSHKYAKQCAISLIGCFVLLSSGLHAQTARTNSPPRVYKDTVDPHWFADPNGLSDLFWYKVNVASNRAEFVLVDTVKGTRSPAFDHARLAAALMKKTGQPVEATQLPVDSLKFSTDGKTISLQRGETIWNLDLKTYDLTRASGVEADNLPVTLRPHPSPASVDETTITFVNRLKQDVDIFWMDDTGVRTAYGSLSPGETREQHTYVGHVWLVAAKNGEVIAVFDASDKPGRAVVAESGRKTRPHPLRSEISGVQSPDQKWEVLVRGHNLFLREVKGGEVRQLTYDANPDNSYARNTEADQSIEMNYDSHAPAQALPEVYWSPDSRHFVAMKYRTGTQHRIYMVQSSPEDQLQPKLVSYPYLKPGDEVPYGKPHLFDAKAKNETPVADTLFANPWSISDIHWWPDSSEFTFLFNQRGHQMMRVLGVDAKTGKVRPVVEEQSPTFIFYSRPNFSEYLDDTGEIIWMSERDGWNQLYLYDAKTGKVKNQITKGEWVVRGVDRVDRQKRQIWFHAGGINPGEDPYYLQYCRVNFDGTGLTVLTAGNGDHKVQFSPDNRFLIDTWSRVNLPPVNDLRRAEDGKLVCHLEQADANELIASGWITPEPFVVKGRDGTTDIYGAIWRPKGFDPKKKYPVLENIYAGPQDSFTPKSFRPAYRIQSLIDRGFIVVQMDGMGTANRSKKFHDVCWKNLQDAGFPDRILWIKAAAQKYPCMDLTRVGIFGTSAGGQDALRGILDYPDFYRACMADSGCHDNRMDKIWWNEQWLGWPVDESYARSSNTVDAHKLKGRLLLMVGEMDNNVDPATTMQVVNELIKADKDFELLYMPGAGHGVVGTPYGARRMAEFFERAFLPDHKN